MSQQNVESLRAWLALWNGRKLRPEDHPWERALAHEAALSIITADTVYVDLNLPDHAGEDYRGPDGIRRASERWLEDFEWLLVELQEIIDAGERVVSIHKGQVKMRHTGLEFEAPLAYVWTFREGMLVHGQSFMDVADAFDAAAIESPKADST